MNARGYQHDGPIVVGIDGSPEALEAVRWAAREAAIRDRPVNLVYAKEWPVAGLPMWPVWNAEFGKSLDEAAVSLLSAAKATISELAPEVTVISESVEGTASSVLLTAAEKANLVVLGRRGTGGFGNILIGSTAVHVTRHAACPTAVVPLPHDQSKRDWIVTGIDGSAHSQDTLELAFQESSLRRAPLRVVRAWSHPVLDAPALDLPFPPLPEDLVAEQERVVGETVAGWSEKYPDVHVERVVVKRHVVRALLENSHDAQLLIVGARGEGGFAGLLLGSVSEALVRHAECPVIVGRIQ
ncbi:MAG: universal stress protein [Corynebacteriales bacterium]|nr:universal stress protein [Mycobacteriales bacterium]